MHNSATATPLPELSETAHQGTANALLLDALWLAVKEAAIPALIGAAVSVTKRTWYPFVYSPLCRPTLTTVERVQAASLEGQRHHSRMVRLKLEAVRIRQIPNQRLDTRS